MRFSARNLRRWMCCPATDRVYIFRYGEEEKSVEVSPQLTERYLPINFLQRLQRRRHAGHQHDGGGAPDDHRKIHPARRSRSLRFFGRQSVDAIRLGAAAISCKRNGSRISSSSCSRPICANPTEIEVIRRHLAGHRPAKTWASRRRSSRSPRARRYSRAPPALDKERLWKESEFAPLEEQINLTWSPNPECDMSEAAIDLRKPRGSFSAKSPKRCAASFETIKRDEEHLARLMHFLQARKEQTLRQVARISPRSRAGLPRLRRTGNAGCSKSKLSFWRTWRLILADASNGSRISRTKWKRSCARSVQPQVENAVQLLETDLRGLWPQLQDMIEAQFAGDVKSRMTQDDSRFRAATPRAVAIDPAHSGRARRGQRHWKNNWRACSGKLRPGCACRRASRRRAESSR